MKKIFLLLPLFFFVSCFYSEMQVDYTIKGCDELDVFCWADCFYTPKEVGDTVDPYYKYFVLKIRNLEKYGVSLPAFVREKVSAEDVSLIDECGNKVNLFVTVRNGQEIISVDLKGIAFQPGLYGGILISVQTPSIPSYEIEIKIEKKDGMVYVFSFGMTQERKKKWYFIPSELLSM